ncbi:MAG: iron chelate uptake ABC transporter family permease subunit [Chloroflexi bacterium]|nr:iron chelate uptake ABC transporter family permease subunit [Chloroflexota bacterium]
MSQWLVLRLDRPELSIRVDRRALPLLLGLTLAAFGAVVLHVALGVYPISPPEVARTLLGGGSPEQSFIIHALRLPRALVAFAVGAGLAVSGAILQGLTRNPLAAPDVVGVSGGASLAAVVVIVLFPGVPVAVLPAAAFVGALLAAVLVYLLAWRQGTSPVRLILVGIGVAAVGHALVTALITRTVVYAGYATRAMIWMTGSVYGRSWEHLWPLLPWLLVLLPVAFLGARHLNSLHLGDDLARGLGSRVEWQRAWLLMTAVALAAASVATAGPVAFVGLMAPHIARRLTGPSHGALLPAAASVGGLIVVGADLLGRTLFAPIEVPCGVITAAVGAPYLISLLYRNRRV